MATATPPQPTLVLSWGNPSRGDDAIGPLLHERLQQVNLPGVEALTDFQLQIEHSVDIQDRETVYFVDASVSITTPYSLTTIEPEQDPSFTTHALSPQALLAISRQVNGNLPKNCFLLAIRGYDFDLGRPLTESAKNNLDQAWLTLKKRLGGT